MRKHNFYLVPVIMLALLSCTGKNPDPEAAASFDLQQETQWVKDAVKKFSEDYRKGDTMAIANYYASDALVMPPGMKSIPKEGVANMWGETMRMGVKDLDLNVENVSGNEDFLCETGQYKMLGDNQAVLEEGKYITVLKKVNGEWKIFRDIWNTSQ